MSDKVGSSRFEDSRGVIQDILGPPIDAVTEIFSNKGAVRGNHCHQITTQWTYVVSGELLVATRRLRGKQHEQVYTQGELMTDLPGIWHAWQALTDCTVLVFTRGPRSGQDYESDVIRLPAEERLL